MAKCSIIPPSVTLLGYMTALVRKHVLINTFCFTTGIITEIRALKILIGSCTDLNVDSGSGSSSGSNLNYWLAGFCSSLKCKLRPESTPGLRLRDHLCLFWSLSSWQQSRDRNCTIFGNLPHLNESHMRWTSWTRWSVWFWRSIFLGLID